MLLEYVRTAMRHAHYEILDEGEGFYAEIPECRGVFANAQTLEACREQLAEVLEDWLLLRVSRNLDLPIIDGAEIRLREVA
jgi:predicted RNase H-like HicB family nuclease